MFYLSICIQKHEPTWLSLQLHAKGATLKLQTQNWGSEALLMGKDHHEKCKISQPPQKDSTHITWSE